VGITTADPFPDEEAIALERLEQGLMDGMDWYTAHRVHRGTHPRTLLPNAKSIIALAINYYHDSSDEQRTAKDTQGDVSFDVLPTGPLTGRIARYAWGRDYHYIFEAKLKRFIESLKSLGATEAKLYSDTGPMLDRAVAERAGVGWYGKNTNILTQALGSWVFLAQVITDLELRPDKPLSKSCGRCQKCIPACPTNAIIAPYVVDSRKCIAYLTIEHRGSIPVELRPLMGDWVFGCDICQEVCPVNLRRQKDTTEPEFQPKDSMRYRPDLLRILEMTEEEFQEVYRGSPIKRARLEGLKRNVCVALGNIGDPRAVPALRKALEDESPIVREHAAWALDRLTSHDIQ
jgi:epoxyqueuosine reductase